MLASLTIIVVLMTSGYHFGIFNGEYTMWIGLILSPLITLTAIAFINFDKLDQNSRYTTEQLDAVKSASSTPITIIKSPILWFGLISLAVIAGFVFI